MKMGRSVTEGEAEFVTAYEVINTIRPDKERSAVSRVQSAYGDRYQSLMMYDSKRDVSDMLSEETEVRSILGNVCARNSNHSGRRNPNIMNRNDDHSGSTFCDALLLKPF